MSKGKGVCNKFPGVELQILALITAINAHLSPSYP